MKKLIELDAALSAIGEVPTYNDGMVFEALSHAQRDVELLPTVDAVPVVHGHWKEDPSGYCFWICSACGFVSEASAADMLYKFCPVCGAIMDGKEDGSHEQRGEKAQKGTGAGAPEAEDQGAGAQL